MGYRLLAQVILAADDDDEIIRSTLIKGYDFLKKSQVTENPPGDHLKTFRHITKGGWNFPDKDQGLPDSDCTAESLECCLMFETMPQEFIGEKMDVKRLYDAVNLILHFQNKNGGVTAWEPAPGKTWLEWFSPVEFMKDAVVEHEFVECTGSALVAIARFMKQFPEYKRKQVKDFIKHGVKYLENLQMSDGSWYGSWGVCFIYGTFFAVRGLVAAGKTYNDCEAIRRGNEWGVKCKSEAPLSYPHSSYHTSHSAASLLLLSLLHRSCSSGPQGVKSVAELVRQTGGDHLPISLRIGWTGQTRFNRSGTGSAWINRMMYSALDGGHPTFTDFPSRSSIVVSSVRGRIQPNSM
ncbi:hypothetical protein Bca52824_065820 [Brassica carinata]|uniref:Squalene cyclase C-terminal domain-containing protein n=1 Tax=Brassica carinata TaxID=52824 RepID=A0A8X7QJ38_BRACI|nr:hypothetical protein Bca52824_065820 [Brassica carinata]